MKIGLFAINYGTCGDPASAVQVAQAAEAAGFESVWTGEHIVLPRYEATHTERHSPVPLADILRNIDAVSRITAAFAN